MPELHERPELFNPRALSYRDNRNLRALGLARLSYKGKTILRLKQHESHLCKAFLELEKAAQSLEERVMLMCRIVQTLDLIDERRRILVGDPKPSGGSARALPRQLLEIEPTAPDPGQLGVD
jgi:hypothetical protein